jgi:predicted Zn finger-like uncharacterized protein
MTTILIKCPKCKAQYKIKDAEEKEGKKVLCKTCHVPILIHVPTSAGKTSGGKANARKSAADEDEFGGGESFGDDFGVPAASTARAPLPARRTKKKTGTLQKSKTGDGEQKSEGLAKKPPEKINTKALIVVIAIGVLLLAGAGVGGLLLARSGSSAKYAQPADAEYVDFRPKNGGINCRVPKSWKQDWGGGSGGQPYWIRVGDDRITIEARESVSGGAMAQAAIAAQQKTDPSGKDDELSPVAHIHETQQKQFAESYEGYEEGPSRKITTQYGEARVSDFSAKEGIFKSKVNGCRATLMNTIHQFTVSFKCSPSMYPDAKAVFEKVLQSMGPGSGP